jgi:GTP-binding protein EngB required for normal cell division
MNQPPVNPENLVSDLEHWSEENLLPLLSRLDNSELSEELSRLRVQLGRLALGCAAIHPVCLLGQAGVGKSTLLNTLIADTQIVVPSGGGTGPLTANALRVRYGECPSFEVRYHSREKINQLRFIIDTVHHRNTIVGGAEVPPVTPESEPEETLDLELDSEEQKSTRLNEAIRSAQLLIAGSQTADRTLAYLSDALRQILGNPGRFDSIFSIEDTERIIEVSEVLNFASREEDRRYHHGEESFRIQLRNHACGFLAPLIKEMSIEWPSKMLEQGVEIVDLPGIGIMSDVYESITSEYLGNRAKAVVLVADSRGLRRDDAELLRNSGFLSRLLHCADDPTSDPVMLMVVVVKIDDVATENWRNDREMNGTAQKTKAQHFADVVESCSQDIRHQLSRFIRSVWSNEDGTLSDEKQQAMERLMSDLRVFPVSAPQYRLHCENDNDEERPFLPNPESTNIPGLRQSIVEVAQLHRDLSRERFEEGLRRFFGLITSRLEILAAEREIEDVSPQVEAMREALEQMVKPLQSEFENRKGAFLSYLRKSIPEQISDKTEIAAGKAEREINAYLSTLRDAHWATLRAAVRRQGAFHGSRHINLPHDFALRFEEPLAEVWSKGILMGLRRATNEFAEFQENAVCQILAWARAQGMRVPRLLEALVSSVQENKKTLNIAGREAVDELRERVRKDLIKKIENPIRNRCIKFVDAQKDIGAGVKSRILNLFAELARDVINAALEPARTLLIERCREAEKEILKALKEHSNPVEEASDALLERQEKKLQRQQREAANKLSSGEIRGVLASLGARFPTLELKESA